MTVCKRGGSETTDHRPSMATRVARKYTPADREYRRLRNAGFDAACQITRAAHDRFMAGAR